MTHRLTIGSASRTVLIEPTGWRNAKLTSGHATFVSNMTLLGTATAAQNAARRS